ncbi:hypothetical protein CHCC20372_2958 [Bacillus paralicheniformis]|nr:hypothetical protein CHCC20372_2958 [Bacillus paralicheniformis]
MIHLLYYVKHKKEHYLKTHFNQKINFIEKKDKIKSIF